MPVLAKGANAPLSATDVDAVLEWTEPGGASHDVDLCALLLGPDDKVRGDPDFVFYNNPKHASGAVTHRGRDGTTERLNVNIRLLPDDVEAVVLVGSVSNGHFGTIAGLALTLAATDGAGEPLRFDTMGATRETALVVGELYCRNGQWRFRAVGQGWDSGLAGLATNYGVRIGSPEPAVVTHIEPTPVPGPIPVPATSPMAAAPVEAANRRGILPLVTLSPGTPNLESGNSTALSIGQQLSLLKGGRTPQSIWLRVTHSTPDAGVQADLAVLGYDENGTPRALVHYGGASGAGGGVRVVGKGTSGVEEDTAAVELRLEDVDTTIAAFVIAVTSYQGTSLRRNGSFVTKVLSADGTVHAQSESSAPDATGVLLVTVRRDSVGNWLLTHIGSAAAARTVKGLVGAGYWALRD